MSKTDLQQGFDGGEGPTVVELDVGYGVAGDSGPAFSPAHQAVRLLTPAIRPDVTHPPERPYFARDRPLTVKPWLALKHAFGARHCLANTAEADQGCGQ
jgi:hypothetical protein